MLSSLFSQLLVIKYDFLEIHTREGNYSLIYIGINFNIFNQCLSGEHYKKEIKNLWPLKIDENRKWFFKNDKIPDLVLYNVAKIFLVSTVYLSTVIFLTTLMATRKYCKGTERDNLIFTLLLWPPALKTLNTFYVIQLEL